MFEKRNTKECSTSKEKFGIFQLCVIIAVNNMQICVILC